MLGLLLGLALLVVAIFWFQRQGRHSNHSNGHGQSRHGGHSKHGGHGGCH